MERFGSRSNLFKKNLVSDKFKPTYSFLPTDNKTSIFKK